MMNNVSFFELVTRHRLRKCFGMDVADTSMRIKSRINDNILLSRRDVKGNPFAVGI